MKYSYANDDYSSKIQAGIGKVSTKEDKYLLQLYIPHRPTMAEYENLQDIQPINNGDIDKIIIACGNHWRKIFVIFAKIASAIDDRELSWKTYLAEHLLQDSGSERLVFCEDLQFLDKEPASVIHIFSGKYCGDTAGHIQQCSEIAPGFFQNEKGQIFITPYFDYRQFSNAKIDFFITQLKPLLITINN